MRLDHLLSRENMPGGSPWRILRSGTFIPVLLFGFEGPVRDFQNYKIFSAVQMQGRASERREIIRAYIDRARRGPDAADAGNKDVSGP